jgi:uncharacterized small protein (DUF1192 family)
MLFEDENDSRTGQPKLRSLDKLSVAELRDYIVQLKAEITRTETELGKKEQHKSAMEALFKSSADS